MNSIQNYKTDKATVCYKNTCTTVYGETARVVNTIVVGLLIATSIALLAKLAKAI